MTFSPDFPQERLEFSRTAIAKSIDNSIPPALLDNAMRLSELLQFIEKMVWDKWQTTLDLTSGYRCPDLNTRVGGSTTSAHKLALAADIKAVGVSAYEFAKYLAEYLTGYDQIICEYGRWIHVGLAQAGKEPRHQLLTAKRRPNAQGVMKTVYLNGIVA